MQEWGSAYTRDGLYASIYGNVLSVAVCTGLCEACGIDIVNLNEACQAMGRFYHTNCFLCSLCRTFSFVIVCFMWMRSCKPAVLLCKPFSQSWVTDLFLSSCHRVAKSFYFVSCRSSDVQLGMNWMCTCML